MPGRNGGTLRRGGGKVAKSLPPEFFRVFAAGDKKLGLLPRRDRLAALLTCGDLNVQARVEQLLLEHEYGRPAQAVEHSGEIASRFAIEVPRPLSREEWLRAHAASQAAIAAAEGAPN